MNGDAQLTEIGRVLGTRADKPRRDEYGITEHNIAARALFDRNPAKYDVVTDISPEVIDDQSDVGNKTLEMYRTLIEALASNDRYVMLARIEPSSNPVPVIDGVEAPHLAVVSAYIRIFEQPMPDNLHYVKGNGDSLIMLEGLHSVLKITLGSHIERYMGANAIVAEQAQTEVRTAIRPGDATPELDLDLIIASADDLNELYDKLLQLSGQIPPTVERSPDHTIPVKSGLFAWAVEQQKTA